MDFLGKIARYSLARPFAVKDGTVGEKSVWYSLPMRTDRERNYWAFVALILIITVADAILTLLSTFSAPIGHPWWRTIVHVPAQWLLPMGLLNGVMLLMVVIPELTWRIFVASLTALTLSPLAMAGWFYVSRHRSLRLRSMVLASLVAAGVAINLLVGLMWRLV